jgi:hypothetical protein
MRRAALGLLLLPLLLLPLLTTAARAAVPDDPLELRQDPWERAHAINHPTIHVTSPPVLHRGLHISLGTGVLLTPLLTRAETTVDGHPGSSTVVPAAGGGMGISAELEWWPLETPLFGTGIYGSGFAGLLPDMHGGALLGGVRARLGPDAWLSVLADAGLAWRTAAIDARGGDTVRNHDVNARISGSANEGVTRLGAGVRLCVRSDSRDRRFCGVPLDLLVYRDGLRGEGATTWRAQLRLRNAFSFGAEVSQDYPMLGAKGGGTGILAMAHLGIGVDRLLPW